MSLKPSSFSVMEWLDKLSNSWGTSIAEDCQRLSIDIPADLGEGQVIGYTINDGLEFLIIHATFQEDWSISPKSEQQTSVLFFSLAYGAFDICLAEAGEPSLQLSPLQSAIYTPPPKQQATWHFPAQQKVLMSGIFLHKAPFFETIDCETLEIPNELVDILYDIGDYQDFSFSDIFYAPITSSLQEIVNQEKVGLLNSTFATAKVYEMLFFQLRQYELTIGPTTNEQKQLSDSMPQLISAESLLVSQLQNPPTIPELAKMVGMNQQALKKGFKQLYSTTINKYLNNKRLEQAAILIQAGQLKMQDIAQEVGYCNASYFSKRFKEAYGVSPKSYLDKHEQMATS